MFLIITSFLFQTLTIAYFCRVKPAKNMMELLDSIGPIFLLLGGVIIALLFTIYYVVLHDKEEKAE